MAQITWRVDDHLAAQVKAAAGAANRSVNEFLTVVLSAVTDPDLAGSEAATLRERLQRAGLLADHCEIAATGEQPDPAAVVAAGRRAATGTPLSDLVAEGR